MARINLNIDDDLHAVLTDKASKDFTTVTQLINIAVRDMYVLGAHPVQTIQSSPTHKQQPQSQPSQEPTPTTTKPARNKVTIPYLYEDGDIDEKHGGQIGCSLKKKEYDMFTTPLISLDTPLNIKTFRTDIGMTNDMKDIPINGPIARRIELDFIAGHYDKYLAGGLKFVDHIHSLAPDQTELVLIDMNSNTPHKKMYIPSPNNTYYDFFAFLHLDSFTQRQAFSTDRVFDRKEYRNGKEENIQGLHYPDSLPPLSQIPTKGIIEI